MVARKDSVLLKSFAPLKIKFSLEGGYILNYRIENKEAFTYEEAKVQVPKFWQGHFASGKGKVVMVLTVLILLNNLIVKHLNIYCCPL